jgi:hypothetical protein
LLESRNNSLKIIKKTTSEEMSANTPPSPPKTPEMQKYKTTNSVFECDHDDLEGSDNEITRKNAT